MVFKQQQLSCLMNSLELETVTLIDVGARWGIPKRWQPLRHHLCTIGFEPDPEECKKLNECNSGRSVTYPVALTDKVGREVINIAKEPGRSSLYLPNFNFLSRFPDSEGFEIVDHIEVPTSTLDNCLLENKTPYADFVKMDVQGSEKKIIEGGINSFRDLIFGMEVEVEFSKFYVGQPLFSDIDCLCRQMGFTLFDLKPAYMKRLEEPIYGVGQLACADALYFKDYIQQNYIPDPRSAAVALIVSSLYDKFDYALELLDYFYETNVYSIKTYERAKKILQKSSKLSFPFNLKFRGRLRIANILNRLSQKLKTAYWTRWDDWEI